MHRHPIHTTASAPRTAHRSLPVSLCVVLAALRNHGRYPGIPSRRVPKTRLSLSGYVVRGFHRYLSAGFMPWSG